MNEDIDLNIEDWDDWMVKELAIWQRWGDGWIDQELEPVLADSKWIANE